jgi:hypothetical protein
MKILNLIQGSEAWFDARMGVPTASRFSEIITAKTGALSTSAKKYAAELIVERKGFESPAFMTEAMEHGIVTEDAARKWFQFRHDVDIDQVGMVTTDDGRIACSPDGLVPQVPDPEPDYSYAYDYQAGWECKCPQAKTHQMYLMDAKLPDAYKQQVHGSMWVCEVDTWWFMSYCAGLEPFVIQVERDEYTEKVGKALTIFADQLEMLWEMHK